MKAQHGTEVGRITVQENCLLLRGKKGIVILYSAVDPLRWWSAHLRRYLGVGAPRYCCIFCFAGNIIAVFLCSVKRRLSQKYGEKCRLKNHEKIISDRLTKKSETFIIEP